METKTMETIKAVLYINVQRYSYETANKYITQVKDHINNLDWIEFFIIVAEDRATELVVLNRPIVVTSEEQKREIKELQKQLLTITEQLNAKHKD